LTTIIDNNKIDSFDKAEAYRFRGLIYKEKDSLDKAIADFTSSIRYNSKSDFAFAKRGFC
jgi:hypothetical protein